MDSTAKPEPTKDELQSARPGTVDTDTLAFIGLRGDSALHLSREALERALAALPAAPRDEGSIDLLLARGPEGQRVLPSEAQLTAAGGMPADRWFGNGRYGADYQLTAIRTDVARVVANGQALPLHGDNLFLSLDLSTENLPTGTLLQLGAATVRVTAVPHNGCKKWVQRFGLNPMQLHLDPRYKPQRLRGLYFQVVDDGLVRVGDRVRVLTRPSLE